MMSWGDLIGLERGIDTGIQSMKHWHEMGNHSEW